MQTSQTYPYFHSRCLHPSWLPRNGHLCQINMWYMNQLSLSPGQTVAESSLKLHLISIFKGKSSKAIMETMSWKTCSWFWIMKFLFYWIASLPVKYNCPKIIAVQGPATSTRTNTDRQLSWMTVLNIKLASVKPDCFSLLGYSGWSLGNGCGSLSPPSPVLCCSHLCR